MDDLDSRLGALEAHVSVESGPPELGTNGRRRRLAVAAVSAPAMALVLAATTLAGAAFIFGPAQAPSSPVANAGLECMTPPAAAAWLDAHGYKNVVWDTTGGYISNPDGSPFVLTDPGDGPVVTGPAAQFDPTTTPHGLVVPGPMIDGQLVMFVDLNNGAQLPAACGN